MASVRINVMMVSEESSDFYTTTVNPRTQTEKLRLKKYDRVLRKHVWFAQKKIKK